MKNYIKPGRVMTVVAPAGGLTSGNGYLVGSLFGVVALTAAEGAESEIVTEGVFEMAKNSAEAWAVGDTIYWDDTNKVLTTVATANTKVGVAAAVAANPSGTGQVRLNGSL